MEIVSERFRSAFHRGPELTGSGAVEENNNNIQVNTNNSGALGMMLGQNEVQEATIGQQRLFCAIRRCRGFEYQLPDQIRSNAFHGNAAYYWNGSALNANDWIDNAQGNPRPFDIANQWAASLGGPILKDKLFFFFDTEGMHLVLPFSNSVVLPSAQFESATMANIDEIYLSEIWRVANPAQTEASFPMMLNGLTRAIFLPA